MVEAATLDAAFNFIITRLVDAGQAPHYSELANHLSLSIEDGRNVLHELGKDGALRLHPDADLIESVAPFSSIPTQYRITVDGEQKWFGQ